MKAKTNQSLSVCAVFIIIVTILGTINLSEQRKYESSIFTAAIHGKENLIKEFVKSGANIDSQDEYGATPIHYKLGTPKFLNFWLSVKQVLISWIKKA